MKKNSKAKPKKRPAVVAQEEEDDGEDNSTIKDKDEEEEEADMVPEKRLLLEQDYQQKEEEEADTVTEGGLFLEEDYEQKEEEADMVPEEGLLLEEDYEQEEHLETGSSDGVEEDGQQDGNGQWDQDELPLPYFTDVNVPVTPHRSDSEEHSEINSDDESKGNTGEHRSFNVSLSAKEYQKYQYHFIGVFYARLFRTQHMSDPVLKQDAFGRSLTDLHKCIWEISSKYVSREVVVEHEDTEKNVKWASKHTPDVSDIGKFILLKHGKTKKNYSFEELNENTRLLSKWRGSEVQVHIFKHSIAIATATLWDMVNKKLLHPEKKDKAGAPATEEIFDCVEQLKTMHSEYTALYASWEKWANYILSQPGDVRPKLIKEAPPDEYLHLFRAVPLSEGSRIQASRHGLQVAVNINESIALSVDKLCERIDSVAASVSDIQIEVHELRAQIRNSRSLLDAMQTSLPPEESEFSRKLAAKVTDADDVDHEG